MPQADEGQGEGIERNVENELFNENVFFTMDTIDCILQVLEMAAKGDWKR